LAIVQLAIALISVHSKNILRWANVCLWAWLF